MSQPIYEIPVTPPRRAHGGDQADADPATAGLVEEPLPWYLQDPADSPPVEPVVFTSKYDQPAEPVTVYPTHAEPSHLVADIETYDEQRPDLTRSALDPVSSDVLRPREGVPAVLGRSRRAQRADDDVVAPDQDLLDALQEVLDLDGSDLHVTVGAPPNIRVSGSLRPLDNADRWMRDKVRTALYSLLTPAQQGQFERELELDFAYTANGARFRVNYYQQRRDRKSVV